MILIVDNIKEMVYTLTVPKRYGKEGKAMNEDKMKALKELLKLLAENPDVADRITVTFKPGKLTESKPPAKPKK